MLLSADNNGLLEQHRGKINKKSYELFIILKRKEIVLRGVWNNGINSGPFCNAVVLALILIINKLRDVEK